MPLSRHILRRALGSGSGTRGSKGTKSQGAMALLKNPAMRNDPRRIPLVHACSCTHFSESTCRVPSQQPGLWLVRSQQPPRATSCFRLVQERSPQPCFRVPWVSGILTNASVFHIHAHHYRGHYLCNDIRYPSPHIGSVFRCLPNEVYPVGLVSLCSISSIKP